jgi:hypothetical protein
VGVVSATLRTLRDKDLDLKEVGTENLETNTGLTMSLHQSRLSKVALVEEAGTHAEEVSMAPSRKNNTAILSKIMTAETKVVTRKTLNIMQQLLTSLDPTLMSLDPISPTEMISMFSLLVTNKILTLQERMTTKEEGIEAEAVATLKNQIIVVATITSKTTNDPDLPMAKMKSLIVMPVAEAMEPKEAACVCVEASRIEAVEIEEASEDTVAETKKEVDIKLAEDTVVIEATSEEEIENSMTEVGSIPRREDNEAVDRATTLTNLKNRENTSKMENSQTSSRKEVTTMKLTEEKSN